MRETWNKQGKLNMPLFSPCLPPAEVDPPVFVPEQHCCCMLYLTLPYRQSENEPHCDHISYVSASKEETEK